MEEMEEELSTSTQSHFFCHVRFVVCNCEEPNCFWCHIESDQEIFKPPAQVCIYKLELRDHTPTELCGVMEETEFKIEGVSKPSFSCPVCYEPEGSPRCKCIAEGLDDGDWKVDAEEEMVLYEEKLKTAYEEYVEDVEEEYYEQLQSETNARCATYTPLFGDFGVNKFVFSMCG